MSLDRRGFFGLVAKATAAVGVSAAAVDTVAPVSRIPFVLDVDGHRRHLELHGETLHVLVNGVDVTRTAFWASVPTGEVFVFKRDVDGRHFIDPYTGTAAKELLRGVVSIVPGEAFS